MKILVKVLNKISSKAKEYEKKAYNNYCKGLEAKHVKLQTQLKENDAEYQKWLEEQDGKTGSI